MAVRVWQGAARRSTLCVAQKLTDSAAGEQGQILLDAGVGLEPAELDKVHLFDVLQRRV